MIDPKSPYVIFGVTLLVGLFGWFVRTYILKPLEKIDKDQEGLQSRMVAVETSLRYYLETTGKGAAVALNSPNPTPPDMQDLLKKYVAGRLIDEEERRCLRNWLEEILNTPGLPRDKYSAAVNLRASMGAMKRLAPKRGDVS